MHPASISFLKSHLLDFGGLCARVCERNIHSGVEEAGSVSSASATPEDKPRSGFQTCLLDG